MFKGRDFATPNRAIVYNRVANFAECKEPTEKRSAGEKYHFVENVQTIPSDRTVVHAEAEKPTAKSTQTASTDSETTPTEPREMREIAADGDNPIATLDSSENGEKPQESAQDKLSVSNFSTARIY
jgi:hypothetical protein